MSDYERGKRDGIKQCAEMLRQIAFVSREEFAEAFRGIAEAWEAGRSPPTPSGSTLDEFTCPGVDFGERH